MRRFKSVIRTSNRANDNLDQRSEINLRLRLLYPIGLHGFDEVG